MRIIAVLFIVFPLVSSAQTLGARANAICNQPREYYNCTDSRIPCWRGHYCQESDQYGPFVRGECHWNVEENVGQCRATSYRGDGQWYGTEPTNAASQNSGQHSSESSVPPDLSHGSSQSVLRAFQNPDAAEQPGNMFGTAPPPEVSESASRPNPLQRLWSSLGSSLGTYLGSEPPAQAAWGDQNSVVQDTSLVRAPITPASPLMPYDFAQNSAALDAMSGGYDYGRGADESLARPTSNESLVSQSTGFGRSPSVEQGNGGLQGFWDYLTNKRSDASEAYARDLIRRGSGLSSQAETFLRSHGLIQSR
ncbi:MAG: hypothetical protein WA021_01900 [Minisyncoccia bacterium]